jgi:hypothetical protein
MIWCSYDFRFKQLSKEQRKYDNMVSDLADQIGRILPFAKQVLEEITYEDTDLLEGAVRKLYDLIMDTAEFICDYVRRSPTIMSHFTVNKLLDWSREERTAKSFVSREDQEKVISLQEDFNKLKEDFDRAVDVESLRMARINGNTTSSRGLFVTNASPIFQRKSDISVA